MADKEETVRIKGDISDLRAQLRAAQAELRTFNAQIATMQGGAFAAQGSGVMTSLGQQAVAHIEAQTAPVKARINDLVNQITIAKNAEAQLGIESEALGEALTFSTLQDGINSMMGLDRTLLSASTSAKTFATAVSPMAATDEALRASATSMADLGAAGAVTFQTLQQGIDSSLGLDRNLNSAALSAKAFTQALAPMAATDAVIRDTALALGIAETEGAVTFKTLQQGIDTSLGIDRGLNSAAASARFFAGQIGPMAAIDSGIRDTAVNTEKLTTAFSNLRVGTSGGIQEMVRMGRAIATGRFDILPSEIATLTSRMGGLSFAILGPVAAVAALAAGFIYLTAKIIESENEILAFKTHADFAGNIGLSGAAMKELADEIGADGQKIVGTFSMMADMSKDELTALSIATEFYAEQTGEKAPEAIKKVKDALDNEKLSIQDLRNLFPGLDDDTLNNFLIVKHMGDAHKTAAAFVDLMDASLKKTGGDIVAQQGGWNGWGNILRLITAYIQDATAGLLPLSSGLEGAIGLWNQFGGAIVKAEEWIDKETSAIRALGAAGRVHNDIMAEAARRQAELKQKMDEAAAAARREHDAIVQIMSQQMTPNESEDKRVHRGREGQAGRDAVAELREELAALNAATQASDEMQYINAVNLWQKLLDGTKLSVNQRKAAEAELSNAERGVYRAAIEEKNRLETEDLESSIRIDKIHLEQTRSIAEEEVAAHQITANQYTAIMQAALDQEYSDDKKALEQKLANLGVLDKDYEKYWNLLTEREQKYYADSDALRRRDQQLQRQEILDQIRDEKAAYSEITNAAQTAFSDILSGRYTLTQSIARAAWDMVTKEIEADARGAIAHLFYTQQELDADKTLGQMGALYHLLFEGKKTASTVAGTATRTATTTTGATAAAVGDIHQGAVHDANEAQMTAATVAGVAARTAVESAGAAAGLAEQAAKGGISILNDAKQAFAGTYAAVAQIPVIGPFLAPIAAAAAFAAVMAYDTLTSAAGGEYNVPNSGGLYQLHKQEAVMPAHVANPMRDFFSGASAENFNKIVPAVDAGDINLHYSPVINYHEPKGLGQMLDEDSRTMLSWVAARARDGSLKKAMATV